MRSFTDRNGVLWQVWRVNPTLRVEGVAPSGFYLSEDAQRGWLCFESRTGERRRLYQTLDNWEALTDAELERLCYHATKPPSRPQLP